MSYDLRLVKDGETVRSSRPHGIIGGTYCLGDTDLRLNVTYNYAGFFYRVFGEKGIRWLYGQTARDTLHPLLDAILSLSAEPSADDYWQPTEGNARESLIGLLRLALAAPDATWEGD